MPVFNGREYLDAALRSLQAQTHPYDELVVVDDGSTDGAGALLDRWAAREPRIRVIHQENRGLPQALNVAWRAARGEWLARMDADDVARPHRFEFQLRYLHENPDIVCLGSAVEVIDPRGRSLSRGFPPAEHADIDARLLQGYGSALYHPTIVLRRATLEAIGGYREEVEMEDLDLFLRLAEHGRVHNLLEVLLDYRLHLRSTNHRRRERHVHMVQACVADALRRRGLDPAQAERLELPERHDTLSAVYADWSCKAFQYHHFRTGCLHAANAWRAGGLKAEGWQRAAKCLKYGLHCWGESQHAQIHR
ncbi:MAG: Glycosyl transferase group 2 family protein [Puniceicoccaceae bacterium 5H]|nr:MAG: Glycosyl transferase group 2 family protein [Puniceicoccaceae bacterium 5H]